MDGCRDFPSPPNQKEESKAIKFLFVAFEKKKKENDESAKS